MMAGVKVKEPGHLYQLDVLDAPTPLRRLAGVHLRFVKRVGDKYPGNIGPPYAGVTTQEVLRALIERTKYVNGQRDDPANYHVLRDLRSALVELEIRAHRERGDQATGTRIAALCEPEMEPTCQTCGHVFCQEKHAW